MSVILINEHLNDLINQFKIDSINGSLNYTWKMRYFFDRFDNHLNSHLISNNLVKKINLVYDLANSSYIYMNKYYKYGVDNTIDAIITMCYNPKQTDEFNHSDVYLDVISNVFNLIIKSTRKNINCYDCGTVARGMFCNLLKKYRSNFFISVDEINKIRDEYFIQRKWSTGVNVLISNLKKVDKSSIFICGLNFGPKKFGHVFIIDVQVIDNKKIIRILQSALNSYLLIDYIYHMDYLNNPHKSMDLKEFKSDMLKLQAVPKWTEKENLIFVKWYCFYPQSEIDDTSNIKFNSSFISYAN